MQIAVIRSIEPEICTKMLRNWNEKLRAKFPASAALGYSVVRMFRLDDASWEILVLAVNPEGQQLQQKDKKRRKGKGGKNKKPKSQKT